MPLLSPPPLPPFLDQALPFERRTFVLEAGPDRGRRIHLILHGDSAAQPILFLHGNPTWSFLWRKVMALLPEFHLVAPDLLGLGFSDRLPRIADHTVERHAGAVSQLVNFLDLRRLILVGQDWGGPILAVAASGWGERVAGIVLGNTSVLVPDRPRGTRFHRFARLPLVSDFAFRVLGFPQNVLHRVQGDPRSLRGEVARAYRWPLRGWRDRVAPLAFARMVPNGPDHPSVPPLRQGEAWIRRFSGPMALVWGERDPILGRALRRHREAFPAAAVTVTQAGHFLQEEVPEALAAAIRGVAKKGAPGPGAAGAG